MKTESEEYLIHYGVLGMKWGVRHDKKKKSYSGPDNGPTVGEVVKNVRTYATKKARQYAVKRTARKLVQAKKEANKAAKREANQKIRAEKEANKAAKIEANRKAKIQKATEKKDRQKSVKKISDEELQRRINRLKMEKEYRSLKEAELSEGSKMVKSILKKSGENIGTQLVTYGMGTLLNKLVGEEIVNPKKGQKDK